MFSSLLLDKCAARALINPESQSEEIETSENVKSARSLLRVKAWAGALDDDDRT